MFVIKEILGSVLGFGLSGLGLEGLGSEFRLEGLGSLVKEGFRV